MIELSWETVLFILLGIHAVWLHWRVSWLRWEHKADRSISENMRGRTLAYLRHAFPKELGDEFADFALYGKKNGKTICPEVDLEE